MKSLHFVVMCLFILLVDCKRPGKSPPSRVLKVTTSQGRDELVDIKFKPTAQKLANKFLPIWIVDKDHPDTLFEQPDVMEELGPFTIYQDSSTTAAAIFFDKQQVMYGIVDSRMIIDELPMNPAVKQIIKNFPRGIVQRGPSRFFETPLIKAKSRISIQLLEPPTAEGDEIVNEETEVTRLRRDVQDVFYIETLVLVNFGMAVRFLKKPDDSPSIVQYVLTLINNVDMLYSKVGDLNIKFNVAGIVIANSDGTWPLDAGGACFEKIKDAEGTLVDNVDVRCVNDFIKSFCHKHHREIPPRTYDIAVLLTRYGLHRHHYDPQTGGKKLVRLGGLAEAPSMDYYNHMEVGTMPTLVATVSDRGDYESFPILAHEIAHLFDVDHDEPTGELEKLMQPRGKHSVNSLSWSRASEESLRKFFGSRSACIFKNKPGSLYPPGPHKIWNAHQQCECYGYKSARIGLTSSFRSTFLSCDENIECLSRTGEMEEGPIFWDGTPCGWKKVCWAQQCVNRQK